MHAVSTIQIADILQKPIITVEWIISNDFLEV